MGSSSQAGPSVRVLDSLAAFTTACVEWRSGQSFPILFGPIWERYQRRLDGAAAPSVCEEAREGVVVSVGSAPEHALARVLAAATQRAHEETTEEGLAACLWRHAADPVALIGLVDVFERYGDWPGALAPLTGVLTGRTRSALSALVYRSLTAYQPSDRRSLLVSHPLLDGAAHADITSIDRLPEITRHSTDLLVLRGQGRECCMSVLDGMLCGRDRPLGQTIPVRERMRRTPCVDGGGCFRVDLTSDELIDASLVQAKVVFSQSCSAISIGTNAYPTGIALSLRLLEGTAVAVAGAVGVHVVHASAQWDLEDALDAGLPLGRAIQQVAARSRPQHGELSRFGLLGDPGLVLRPSAGSSASAPPFAAASAAARSTMDQVSLDRLRRQQTTLRRLQRLPFISVDVDEMAIADVEKKIRVLAATPFDRELPVAVDDVERQVDGLQVSILQRLAAKIGAPGWDPGWRSTGFVQVSAQARTCPQCQRPVASELVLQHRIEAELTFRTLQCRRCGDVWWTTQNGPRTVALDGPLDVVCIRAGSITLDRVVVNSESVAVAGAAAYGFRGRGNLGVPTGQVQPVHVAAHSSAPIRFDVAFDLGVPADTHTMIVVGLLNGILTTSMVMLELREPGEPS